MRPVHALFDRYAQSHRHPANKRIHWLCVPLITWSVLAFAWALSPVAAIVLVIAATGFYAWLSVPLAVGMLAVLAAMLYPIVLLGARVGAVAAVVFVLAWIGQFAGHAIERARPSFVDDLKFLLVGPAWLLADLYRRLGLRY